MNFREEREINVPLVSIILPVFNGEEFLREAIDSILTQSFKDFELIVVDDASQDQSLKILESYRDPRLIVIKNEVNSGIVIALNKGIKASQGKYIARMDADDISIPDRLKKQIDFLESHPEIGVVGSWGEFIDEKGNSISFVAYPITDNDIKSCLLVKNCIFHPSVMMRREVIVEREYKAGYKHAEDYWLWSELMESTKFHNIPDYLIKYRIRGNNVSILANHLVNQRHEILSKIYKRQLENAGVRLSEKELEVFTISVTMIEKLKPEMYSDFITIMQKVIRELPPYYNKKILDNYFYFIWAWHTRFKKWNLRTFSLNLRGMLSYIKFKRNNNNLFKTQ